MNYLTPQYAQFPSTSSSISPSPPDISPENMDRKQKKPLMEKRRRERINSSLSVMKEILMEASPHQTSKLEKADILDSTVLYIRRLQAQVGGPQVKRSKEEARSFMRTGYDLGWRVTGQMAQQYLQAVLPPQSGHHATQIHLGFLEQLKKVQEPPAFPPFFPGFMIGNEKLVSPIPGISTTKSSPTSPDSAYGCSPETTSITSIKRPLCSSVPVFPMTPLARPQPPPPPPVREKEPKIDVEEEDEVDSDFEDEPTPPSPKRQKRHGSLWRPF